MEESYREVQAWLETLYAGQPVPQYEINSQNLKILSQLMDQNRKQDQCIEYVIQDWQQKAEEFNSEAERIGRILQKVGLTVGCLSQSGSVSLKTLVAIASLLKVQTPSNSNILLAMNETVEERLCVVDTRQLEQKLSSQIFAKTRKQLQLCSMLQKSLQNYDEQSDRDVSKIENKATKAAFLKSKVSEYIRNVDQLKSELASTGIDPSSYHSTLVKKSEELKSDKDRLHAVKAKLDSYHSLPPDLSLARVKVEEAKMELAALEAELSQFIDLMHT